MTWEAAAAAREELLEEFGRRDDFEVKTSSIIHGEIEAGERIVPVDIAIPAGFPYQPPTVRPIDGTGGLSWHANPDGTLCLWATAECSDLPWLHVEEIIERAQAWFLNEAAGWPDDPPDLDLERYWPPGLGFVVYPDLEPLIGHPARADRNRHGWQIKPGPAPENSRQAAAFVIDVGELARPVHTYAEICEHLDPHVTTRLDRLIRDGKVRLLVVRYWRSGSSGVLALLVTKRHPVELEAVTAAHRGEATIHLRAGGDRVVLRDKRVAIVGVGAVGSVAADLLARAGIGHLTLIDPERVRPGNCIRHLAGPDAVGTAKVDAVKARLIADGTLTGTVDTRPEQLLSPDDATQVVSVHDLVVDATANGVASRLLLDAGSALGRSVVSACLLRDGQVARVDRVPLATGEQHAPQTPDLTERPPAAYESGCGDRVSPTPMWAVHAAASRAVGMAVDLLTGRRQYPPSIVDVLVAGDGCPTIGTTIGTRP